MSSRKTIQDIINKKNNGEKVVMLTAYDHPSAKIIDEAGVDIVLVGDSVANVVLGLESTRDVGMEEMLHHARAVNLGVRNALFVGDMPYDSYQEKPKEAARNARRFVEEAGCDAVKLEWFPECVAVAESIISAGIPVMGHVGLTPQTAGKIGGFVVQGRDAEAAGQLITQSRELEHAGCFSIVLECIPDKISEIITKELSIPTIGIGAGVHCDGQVLVLHDILGLFDAFRPKFVKQYVDVKQLMSEGVKKFKEEVESGKFPGAEHSFRISEEQLQKLKEQ